MKKRTQKKIAKIIAVILSVAVNLTAVSPLGVSMAARLTSIKDTMSSNKISGTGSATAGYTQSASLATDGFIFTATDNDTICLDLGALNNATCTGANDAKADLITNGGLTAETVYTGDQVAAAIKTAIEAQDGDADDSYTVTYNESTDKFTIQGDGGNTLDISLNWLTYTGADDAAAALGYSQAADDANIRTTAATSDNAVAFIVLDNVNDNFTIQIDGKNGATAIDVAAGNYVGGTTETNGGLVDAINTAIAADANFDGTEIVISYNQAGYLDKFRFTSATTGGGSTIRIVEDGTDDFLKTASLVGDVPVDGEASSGIVSANHTFVFTVTTAVAASGKIVITFPSGFSIPANLDFTDIDMSANGGGERTLAAAASGTQDGAVRTSATVITFTLGTTATNTNAGGGEVSGNIAAGTIITIEIGRNATAGVAGVEQIINPTTVGLYKIEVKTTTSGDVTIDDAYVAVYLVSDNSVTVTATVDSILSFALYGGTNIDFGTLEPNAYHKLGGARNAYGSIDLAAITPSGTHDTQTVTVRGIIYEFSDDGTIASTSQAKVDIVDSSGSYLSAVQVAANLARAINNYDGDLVRANIEPTDTDKVWVMAIMPGTAGSSYSLATTVSGASVSGADFTDGVDGYNTKGNAVTYATGSGVGNGSTGTNLVVSTNGAGGYVLTVQNTDTNGTTDGADGLTNGMTEIEEWSGSFGYGLLASSQSARYGDATSTVIESAFQGDGTGDLPGAMSATAATLAQFTTSDINPATTAGDNIAIEYNVRIGTDQAAGSYTDTITYIFTATF